jgi:urease accessory protein
MIPHQRAAGRLDWTFHAAPGSARLRRLHQVAPLRLLTPQVDRGDPLLGVIMNVAGGLAGGDRLQLAGNFAPAARATLTTPSAEKIYRSLGPATEIGCMLDLAAESACEWLPQETILFEGARLRRRMAVGIAPSATLLAIEMLVLGRAARGERLLAGTLHDQWRLHRDGRLIWADALRFDGPAAYGRYALGDGNALAMLLLAAPEASRFRETLRELAQGGASLVAPGLLLARWRGEAKTVRERLGLAVVTLRAAALGHPPRLPRLAWAVL